MTIQETLKTTPVYTARPGQVAYGYPIGMICAQWNIPFVPGDLNNATTFDYPMRYLEVEVSGAAVLRGEGDKYLTTMIEAAKKLESEGVRAITGNCGFMAAYQQAVADAVSIPVFLSSLVQVPMLITMLGTQKKLGMLTANSSAITSELYAGAGVHDSSQVIVCGLEESEHFREVVLEEQGLLDVNRLTQEVVNASMQLVEQNPEVGAIFLECSDLPVYAHAVHEATELPVFEWASFIDYVYRATVPRVFSGLY